MYEHPITACIHEIFNADGVTACDANQGILIDAGDISCTGLLITDEAHTCSPNIGQATAQTAASLTNAGDRTAVAGTTVHLPITLATNGVAVTAAAFRLHFDQEQLRFDPTDDNGDGLPDALAFYQPPLVSQLLITVTAHRDALDLAFIDLATPPGSWYDGIFLTVTLQVKGISSNRKEIYMGVYYDLGRPVIGGWMGGPWVSHDPIQQRDLIWGGEFGQEGSVLFAVDVDNGQVVEEHRIGAREFGVTVEPASGRLWIHTYHGLYQPGHLLLSWQPETRALVSHGFPPISDQRFVGKVLGQDDRVYLGMHPFGHLVSFDPGDGSWRDHGCQAPEPIIPGQQIWCIPQQVTEAGEIICTINRTRPGQTIAFQPATGQTRLLPEPPPPSAPNRTGITRAITADIYAGTYSVDGETRHFHYRPRVATDIVGLNKGPDGKIYGSTIISMHLFSFDPQTRALGDLGRVGFGHGEIYDVIAHQDKLYLGSYTGAYWAVYDPTQGWNPRPDVQGMAADANPRCFGQLGHGMNRPFEYAVGPDGCIYIACRADYGIPGGGLARFDPQSEKITVLRDEEQSVQSVAADERFVYGGTSISGGRGSIATTTEGKLFVFAPETGQRVYSCIPVAGAMAVTSLAVSPVTTLVYGSTDTGYLFAYDREERQVVKRWQLRSQGTPLMGVPETYGIIHLTTGSDGAIYGVTNCELFKLDMRTDQILYLDPPPIPDLYQIVEGAPGIFYIGARGHLLEYHLKDTPHYR